MDLGTHIAWNKHLGTLKLTLLAACIACCASEAMAGGLWMYEDGGPTVGTASAGQAALAIDASTLRGNPAGMTRLDGNQLLVGAQPIILDSKFDRERESTFSGGNGGQAGNVFPSAGIYYSHSISNDLKAGLMFGSYLGLGVDYDDDWVGRYYVQEGELTTVSAIPAVAYRLTDWLSIGGGVGVQYATIDQTAAINNQLTDGAGFPDGSIELDEDSWAPLGYFGVLVEPNDRTRFGLTYISKADHEFDDAVRLRGLGPNLQAALGPVVGSSADLDVTIPQSVMVSAYHELTDDLAIMANLGWQDWSDFGETNVTLSATTTTSVTQDRNFRDTWQVAVGMLYRLNEDWIVSGGVAFDSSPVRNKDRTPDVPLDRQIRLSGGAQYSLSERTTLGFAYTYMDAGSADIRQDGALRGTLDGDYSNNAIHFLAAYVNWAF